MPNNKFSIPYLSLPDKPISDSTQNFIPIAAVEKDVVLFKDGGAAIVLESTSLNFGLLSEKEQEAVIYAYAALLNSLSFPIQILVRTQRKDISNYLTYLDQAATKISNQKLLVLMKNYRQFISESVKKRNVLGKKFYVIIPFSPLELGVTKSFMSATKTRGPLPFPKSYVVKKSKITLYPKRDHLIRQAGRLGLKLKQLDSERLVELYYTVFNPEKPTVKKDEYEEEAGKTV